MNDTTAAQIAEIVADALEMAPEDVADVEQLGDVEGYDSLRRLNVLLAIEESMGVAMSPDDLPAMTSVDRIAEIVSARRA